MNAKVLSRRAALAGIAAATTTAIAVPTVQACTLPDPIFAVIERHRRAWDDLGDLISDLTEAADNGDKNAELKADQLHEAVNAATNELLDVIPTTIAGVSAILNYAADHERHGNRWPGGYVLEDEAPLCGLENEYGVSWNVYLHKQIVKALAKIAKAG